MVGPQEEWNTQCECEEGKEGCRPKERPTERRSTNSIIRGMEEKKEGRGESCKISSPPDSEPECHCQTPSPFPSLNLNCDQSPVAKFNFITAPSVRYCLALSSASAFPKGHLPIRATRRHKEEMSGNENLCFAHSQFAIRIHQCWPIKRTVKSTTRHFTWNTKQIERGNLSPFSFI